MSESGLWQRIFKLMDGLSGATLGFLFYGGWGVFANSAHGATIALRSGFAQGCMSFVVTLSGVMLMRLLFRIPGPVLLRAICSAIGGLAIIYAVIVGVHLYLGTPEILLTLAPGLPITIGFCLVFSSSLARFEGAPAQAPDHETQAGAPLPRP